MIDYCCAYSEADRRRITTRQSIEGHRMKRIVTVLHLCVAVSLAGGCSKPDYNKYAGDYYWQKDDGAHVLLYDRGGFMAAEGTSMARAVEGTYYVEDKKIMATNAADISTPNDFQIQDFRDGKAQFYFEDESLVSVETGERFNKQNGKYDALTRSFLEERLLKNGDLSSYPADEIILLPGHDIFAEVLGMEKGSTITIPKEKFLNMEKTWRNDQKGEKMREFLNILRYRTITKAGELRNSLEDVFRPYRLDSRFMATINRLKQDLRSDDTMVLVKKNDGSNRLHFIFVWRGAPDFYKLVMEFVD
jgi:hypothetical protein